MSTGGGPSEAGLLTRAPAIGQRPARLRLLTAAPFVVAVADWLMPVSVARRRQ